VTGAGGSAAGTPVPALHVVTDDAVLGRADFTATAASLMHVGGPRLALHVRGPRTGGGTLYRLAHGLTGAALEAGALLVVNDRVDVALAVGAHAVQLGRRSLPPRDARKVLGEEALLGVSTHDDQEVADAALDGARWIFAGTIHATPSHAAVEPRGPQAVSAACAVAGGVPIVAIGGVTPERVAALTASGAHGVAAIRGVWDAPEPREAVAVYLEALAAARRGNGVEDIAGSEA